MAVFTRRLRHIAYTSDISFSVFSACFLQLACCQSASFHYGDERKDGTEKRAKTVLFIRGGHRYVHNDNICSRKIETASYAQLSFYGWSTAVVQGPFLDGTRDKNHDGLQISSTTSTMPWVYGRIRSRERAVQSHCCLRSLWLSLYLVCIQPCRAPRSSWHLQASSPPYPPLRFFILC